MTVDRAQFGRTAASAVGWVAVDKWGNRLFSLGILVILGRLLGPDDFGLVALTGVLTAFAIIFADAGFSKSLIQKNSLTERDRSTAFWSTIVLSVFLVIVLVGFANPLALLLGDSRLAPIIQVLSLSILLSGISAVPSALLERDFGFKRLAIRRVAGTVAGGLAAVGAALIGLGVWSLVIQALVTAAVSLVTLWLASNWRPKLTFSQSSFKNLWAVGASVMGIELVGVVSSQADRLLVGTFLGAEALGYYFMAMRIVSILVELFSSVFSAVSLTAFSRLKNDRLQLLGWFYRFAGVSSTSALPVFALACVSAPVMIPLVFGAEWHPSVLPFQILTFLGALNAIGYFDRSILIATGNASWALALTVGQGILGVLLVCVALPWGVVAVSLAVVARQYLFWPIRLFILRRTLGVRPMKYVVTWLKPFSLALVSGGFVVGLTALISDLAEMEALYLLVCITSIALVFGVGTVLFMPDIVSDIKGVIRGRSRGGKIK